MNNLAILLHTHFFEYLTSKEIYQSLPINLLYKLKKYYFPHHTEINIKHFLNVIPKYINYVTIDYRKMTKETFGFRTLLYPDFVRFVANNLESIEEKLEDFIGHDNFLVDVFNNLKDTKNMSTSVFANIFRRNEMIYNKIIKRQKDKRKVK